MSHGGTPSVPGNPASTDPFGPPRAKRNQDEHRGSNPHVGHFARCWVRDAGFTVYMPSLFGRDGTVPDAKEGAAVVQRACVSAEFRDFAADASSPVTQWLRALPRLAHRNAAAPA